MAPKTLGMARMSTLHQITVASKAPLFGPEESLFFEPAEDITYECKNKKKEQAKRKKKKRRTGRKVSLRWD
ncbi:unnamed protein product [Moneuplotes crassus]|uniref:Uncharacterized protein n=1 Tax=Euplotes crassus TaxID=5936 RepID=A0AAD1Y914_EUPCR|nr:unnamed protein product [Moneuplotes crassus]|eukprot:CAMPEP_0196996894 /NCGR_PEP_ID=MMETSP1380-20130617/2676_1 /TAXON_ID=5936 /ORGANISM="Euplotes crassus, Strain CT5" /LENGTH=70 /DNA_ID=CAMNT_0042413007 /DNA_START=45 /DNA_END=257 /DNA_ORIENTATION=-